MQRQKRIATKHQRVPLDPRKSRARLHQPGASGAAGAPRPSEIFYIVGELRWDAVCLWARGGFGHAPKLSPALEMLSSGLRVVGQFRFANPKAKICATSETRPGTRRVKHRQYLRNEVTGVGSSPFRPSRNSNSMRNCASSNCPPALRIRTTAAADVPP